MDLTAEEDRKLSIGESRNGKGIFAKVDFSADEIVFEVTGTFMTCDEEDDVDDQTRANTYRYDEEKYISPKGRIGDFLNHSCSLNAKVKKEDDKLFIVALNTIPKGQEITIDYSTIIASDDTWEMNCNCGNENCRGIIKSFHSLPKQTKQKYISLHMVPSYILN